MKTCFFRGRVGGMTLTAEAPYDGNSSVLVKGNEESWVLGASAHLPHSSVSHGAM